MTSSVPFASYFHKYNFIKIGSDIIRVSWNYLVQRYYDIPRKFFDIIREEYMVNAFKKWQQGENAPDTATVFYQHTRINYTFCHHFHNQIFFILFEKNYHNEKIIIFTEIKDKFRSWTISSNCYNQMLSIPNLDKLPDLSDLDKLRIT